MSAPASLKRAQARSSTRGASRLSGADPLSTPTPEQIRAAREQAGLTQAQAAALAGLGAQSRWAEYESGRIAMDPIRWRYWLHVAGISRIPFRRA